MLEIYLGSGEREIIGVFYERYGHLVLGLCIKYLKNKDEAQDAVIEIFSGLLNDLKKYKIQYFKSWLYVYSKNYCLMQLRKRQSMLKKELDLREHVIMLMDFNEPEHLKEKEDQVMSLRLAMSELHEDQRICVEMFYFRQMSYQQICDATGFSANDVKSRIQNGKRNLKIKLEKKINEGEKG